jgi:hypothetical protein
MVGTELECFLTFPVLYAGESQNLYGAGAAKTESFGKPTCCFLQVPHLDANLKAPQVLGFCAPDTQSRLGLFWVEEGEEGQKPDLKDERPGPGPSW